MVPSFSDCISWFRTWTHVFTNLTTQIIQAAFDYSLVTLGGGGGRWVLFSGWLWGIHTVSGESEYMSSAAPFRDLIPWLPTPGSGLWWNGFRAKLRGFHSVQQKRKHLELVRSWHELGISAGSEGSWEIPSLRMSTKVVVQTSHHVPPQEGSWGLQGSQAAGL